MKTIEEIERRHLLWAIEELAKASGLPNNENAARLIYHLDVTKDILNRVYKNIYDSVDSPQWTEQELKLANEIKSFLYDIKDDDPVSKILYRLIKENQGRITWHSFISSLVKRERGDWAIYEAHNDEITTSPDNWMMLQILDAWQENVNDFWEWKKHSESD